VSGIGNEVLFDGLLGLAFPSLAKTQGPPFLATLNKRGIQAFGMALRGEREGSSITFGDVDDVMKGAPANSSRVDLRLYGIRGKPAFWMVRANANVFGISETKEVYAMMDSGTSFLALPFMDYEIVANYMLREAFLADSCGQLRTGLLLCDCTAPINPLALSFTGEDGSTLSIELTGEDVLEVVGYALDKHKRPMPVCRPALQKLPFTFPFWILGDVFLRRVYAVHDFHRLRLTLFSQVRTAAITPETIDSATRRSGEVSATHDPGAAASSETGVTASVLVATLVISAMAVMAVAFRGFRSRRGAGADGGDRYGVRDDDKPSCGYTAL